MESFEMGAYGMNQVQAGIHMVTKAQERRNSLRTSLVEIAERQIEAEGARSIKARTLAQAAGCSVGAIYNVFNDLQDIVIVVNGRTFAKLGQHVATALEGKQDLPPAERLIAMSYAYLDYASDHPRLWRALFDLRMSSDMDVPDWYLAELARLFSFINGPIRESFPQMNADEADLMTRALFSSVHGIVLLGLENRISGVPRNEIRRMIAMMLRQTTN